VFRKIKRIFLIMLILIAFYSTSYGDDGRLAVAAKASTLGGGVELLARVNSNLTLRVGGNAYSHTYTTSQDDIKYDVDLDLSSVSAILDWHPFNGGFRVSAGILSNDNSIDVDAQSSATYSIGNTTYSGSDVGTLTGSVGFENVAPYVGVGWGNAFGEGKRVGVVFDVGVIFQGTPNVNLTADGTLSDNAAFLEDLALEEEELKDELNEFKYYPVISLGMTYRF